MIKRFFSRKPEKVQINELYENKIAPHIKNIEHFAPYLVNEENYKQTVQHLIQSKDYYESASFDNMETELLDDFFVNLAQYVAVVRTNAMEYARSRNLVYELREIDKLARTHVLTPVHLDQECEEKCTFEKDGYKDTFFCQICGRTPIALFMEQFELSQEHIKDYTKEYFFAQIIWSVIRSLGESSQQVYATICDSESESKKCVNCAYYCSVAKMEFGDEDWHVYARGLRYIDDLKNKLYAKVNIIAKPIRVLKALTDKVIGHENATWEDVSSLIELLELLPDFVKRAVSVKFLEPRGIRLFHAGAKKPKTYKQAAMEAYLVWKLQIK